MRYTTILLLSTTLLFARCGDSGDIKKGEYAHAAQECGEELEAVTVQNERLKEYIQLLEARAEFDRFAYNVQSWSRSPMSEEQMSSTRSIDKKVREIFDTDQLEPLRDDVRNLLDSAEVRVMNPLKDAGAYLEPTVITPAKDYVNKNFNSTVVKVDSALDAKIMKLKSELRD